MGGKLLKDSAAKAASKAQLTKQLQDRRFQANSLGREIKAADKQIEIQMVKVKAIHQEIDLQQSQAEEAAAIETWHRTRYSNEQLCAWFEKNLRSLYYQAYTMAVNAARKAESALTFEGGARATLLRQGGYWDASRDGLMSADHLYLDLKRLESAHADLHSDYCITKIVSLKELDPLALLKLRLKGTCAFAVSETQFDADFPGHYLRRIKSVALSISATVGTAIGMNGTLQLTASQYRTSPLVSSADEYAAQNRDSFRTDRLPLTSAAVSTASTDANGSTFAELIFSDNKDYEPFEGAGAISSWRFDLPQVRRFDYESISDVLLHIRYHSMEGGVTLRTVANQAVQDASRATVEKGQSEGFWTLLDLKNEFPTEWSAFQTQLVSSGGADSAVLKLGDVKARLSFWSRQQPKLSVRTLMWVSLNPAIIKGVSLSGVETPGDSDIQMESLGQSSIKTWKGLNVSWLSDWELTAIKPVLAGDNKVSDNMYMLIHYSV